MSLWAVFLALALQGTNIAPPQSIPQYQEERLRKAEDERQRRVERIKTVVVTDGELRTFLLAGPDGLIPITQGIGLYMVEDIDRMRRERDQEFLRILQAQAILRTMHCDCGAK